jgi:hypothetical protein
VVGSSNEAVGSVAGAGFADILFGRPRGLGMGPIKAHHLQQGTGTGSLKVSTRRRTTTWARFSGWDHRRGPPAGIPIGVPGESIGNLAAVGMATYVYGDTSRCLCQNLLVNRPGTSEAGDRFGAAVAGDESYFAIGSPGRVIGIRTNSGTVALLSHTLDADGRRTAIGGMDQNNSAGSGAAEQDDEFGASLAMTVYRTSATSGSGASMLVIGSSGEMTSAGGTQRTKAGPAILVRVDPDETWHYLL